MLDLSEEYLCLGLKKSFYKLDTYMHMVLILCINKKYKNLVNNYSYKHYN